jgi:hypothetical protein
MVVSVFLTRRLLARLGTKPLLVVGLVSAGIAATAIITLLAQHQNPDKTATTT